MQNHEDLIIVMTNVPDELLAKRIAHILVEDGLAACVNIGAPSLSMYMWKGTMEGTTEVPLVIKTVAGRRQAVMDTIAKAHPFDVPELLVLPVIGSTDAYAAWVREQTR